MVDVGRSNSKCSRRAAVLSAALPSDAVNLLVRHHRMAASPLKIKIPDVLAELTKSKRLSIVMGNLNRLLQHPTNQYLARRALRHLGFLDD
jgi:hypothetical protein